MNATARKPETPAVLTIADLPAAAVERVALRYGLALERVADGDDIPGSFWGAPEAGIIGHRVYVRGDTPLHSCLHELCHVVCMTAERRAGLDRDAGGDDLEECAVCYLQVVLADEIDGVGSARLMQDMDRWGYSFRLGSTARWFEEDADDARDWLRSRGLLHCEGATTWQLRGTD